MFLILETIVVDVYFNIFDNIHCRSSDLTLVSVMKGDLVKIDHP